MQKLAIITGSSAGIGLSLVEEMIKKNYIVFGYSRTNKLTHKHYTVKQVDLSNLTQVRNIELPIFDKVKKVVLINNAATIGTILPLQEKTEKDILYEYNVNLISPILLLRNFINSYFRVKEKLIINISSGASRKPIHSWSTYCSSKSGLDAITRVLSEELQKNYKVFSVYPGVVNTNMQEEIRRSDPDKFPLLSTFLSYYKKNELLSTNYVASEIIKIVENPDKFTSKMIDIRDL